MKFSLTEEYKPVVVAFKHELADYIVVLNEFLQQKHAEEKAKLKKPKLTQQRELKLATFEQECNDRILKELTISLANEATRQKFINVYLRPLLGLCPMEGMPFRGFLFNTKKLEFPSFTTLKWFLNAS